VVLVVKEAGLNKIQTIRKRRKERKGSIHTDVGEGKSEWLAEEVIAR
jgi:hypothetical protein